MVQRISRLSKKDPNNSRKLIHQRPGQARSRAGMNKSKYGQLNDSVTNNITRNLESTRLDDERKLKNKNEEPSTEEDNRYSLADISVIPETQPEKRGINKRKAYKAVFSSDDEEPAAKSKDYSTRSTKLATPPRTKQKLLKSKILAPDTPEMDRKPRLLNRKNLPGPRYIPESDEEML
ncbi:unnamed protein product [Oikopleura dioica]|uniref:Uncharacterized protein n=1 Tax=Oikopleura dioica TaxID=34765 RepID=E4WVA5_OIKDI|nr:unnamed protein product [Oikopleura dioica]